MEETAILSVALLTLLVTSFGAAEECTRYSQCKCRTPSGIEIDLNLLSPASFNVLDTGSGNNYYFSPCKPVEQAVCKTQFKNAAVCQVASATPYDAGDIGTDVFSGDPASNGLMVTFTAATVPAARTSKIALECSEESRLDFVSEAPLNTYNMRLLTPLVCSKTASVGGLSTGSILVIIFFVFFLLYWIGGFIFMKFVRRAEGLEVIPNYDFWKELPLLIRDGITFAARGCKGESTYQKI